MKKILALTVTVAAGAFLASCSNNVQAQSSNDDAKASSAKSAQNTSNQPNIVFVLTDDQRYDAMGFLNPELKTPNMDRMAENGIHFKNAFVTTALCSPSRASIITGNYMHDHGIVDNNTKFGDGAAFFPAKLQEAGYETAFIGKWHMGGHTDSPQPGFDRWISFAGQGHYLPTDKNGKRHVLNIDGTRVEQQGYITDNLNDFTLDFIKKQDGTNPFFVYLSHKAVHSDFIPAERHKSLYKDVKMKPPATMADTPENYEGKPLWVKNQRNSWHGVDFPYHSELDVMEYKRRYNQTLGAVDDGLGEIFKTLEEKGMMDNTIVFLMGDNGFMFGEHGLIDKRNAYEESMRVPLLAMGKNVAKGKVVEDVVAGIDIGPTMIDIAGAPTLGNVDGLSFKDQLQTGGSASEWRDGLLYEYFWEYNYPHTPTTFAVRTDKYKLIQYHGVWDTEELYDLQNDPQETNNLIEDESLIEVRVDLRAKLYALLADGAEEKPSVSYSERFGPGAVFRSRSRSKAAEYPERWLREDGAPDARRHTKNEGGKSAAKRKKKNSGH